MKICVLTHTFPRNDKDVSAAFMKEFADGLAQNGNQVTVITPYDPKFSRKNDPFKVITYKYIWPDSLHLLGYSQTMEEDVKLRKRAYMLLPFMLLFSLITLVKVIKKERIELISVHWILPNGLVAFIASLITKVPYVVTLPGTDVYLASRIKPFGWVAKIIALNGAGITSNSSYLLKRLLNLGISNKPTLIISYPADVSRFKPLEANKNQYREKFGLEVNNFVILAIGRLVYKKGFEYLIKSLPDVLRKHTNVRLLIGGDGDLKPELQKTVEKMGLQDKVIFAGTISRDEILNVYNLADVLVAPSVIDKKGNVDGGPVVCLESMACGKPQIVTNILGMADVVEDGVNGFIVPEKDPQALSAAIEKLVVSPKLRKEMGIKNRQLVTERLGTQSVGKIYTDFFNDVLKNRGVKQKKLSYA